MTLPNFLVIGAGKSGTTSLYQYLNQHPEIYMSPVKEPNFFALMGGERPRFQGPGADERINRWSVTELEAYERLFDGARGEKAIGEASPSYLYMPEAPARIQRYVPEAKLVAVLRDPVKRAYSAYLHTVRSGRERLGFREALRAEEGRILDGWEWIWHYRTVGLYNDQVKRYYDAFGSERVRTYLHEDLSESPVAVSQSMFRFLGVDDSFIPDTSLRHNVSGLPKSRALLSFLKKPSPLKTALRTFVPKGLRKSLFVNLRNRNLSKAPPMPEEARRDLIEAYREDVLRLQDLIGRDLSGWLNPKRP